MSWLPSGQLGREPRLLDGVLDGRRELGDFSLSRLARLGTGVTVEVERRATGAVEQVDLGEYLTLLVGGGGLGTYMRAIPLLVLTDVLDDIGTELISSSARRSFEFFAGPADSVTDLHCDHFDNVLTVTDGQKVIELYEPAQRDLLYLSRGHDYACTHSLVDVQAPDFDRHPAFRHARPTCFVVDAGNALFIPRGWFHFVRNTSPTLGFASFQSSWLERVMRGSLEVLRQASHDRGLYRTKTPCFCRKHRNRSSAFGS